MRLGESRYRTHIWATASSTSVTYVTYFCISSDMTRFGLAENESLTASTIA